MSMSTGKKLWGTPSGGEQSVTEWEHVKTTPKRVIARRGSMRHEYQFDRGRKLPEGALGARGGSFLVDPIILFDDKLTCLRYVAKRCDQRAAALHEKADRLGVEAERWDRLADLEEEIRTYEHSN